MFRQPIPAVLKNLLIINVLMFIATTVLEDSFPQWYAWFGAFYPASPYFKIWQPVTHLFMHGGFSHILFNMFALYSFGIILEQVWGGKIFLKFYVISGLGALLIQWIAQGVSIYMLTGYVFPPQDYQASYEIIQQLKEIYFTPMVGASGAIFGVLVAFGMLFPDAELYLIFIPVPVKAKYIIPVYIVIEMYLSVAKFQWDNIAHYAHLGGALVGFLLVKFWINKKFKRHFF